MKKKQNKNVKLSYATATGPIGYNLKSDIMFHAVMQKSNEALTGLVCALKGMIIQS